MNSEKYLWWVLPFFVIISGNFSPFRVGPVLPIYWLIAAYTISRREILEKFLKSNSYFLPIALVIVIAQVFMSTYTILAQEITGNEFEGAAPPVLYGLLSLFRYVFVLLVSVVLSRASLVSYRGWWGALFIAYCAILIPLYIQAILCFFFGYEIGYLFPTENGMRYGGFVGEPQTISAWLCSISFCLIQGLNLNSKKTIRLAIFSSILGALALTQSTAWILAFLIFVLTRVKWWFVVIVTVALIALGVADPIIEKVSAEVFIISERSITIVAGFELFAKNIWRTLFGYGAGLTPYLITGTEIFSEYPVFDLSSLGRQNIMNSYFELVCELGLVGSTLYLFLLVKALNIFSLRQILMLFPILVGIFGVGGGFCTGYFLICAPILVNLYKIQNKFIPSSAV